MQATEKHRPAHSHPSRGRRTGANAALGTVGELTTVTYVQPRVARPKDYRVLHETVVTFAITKRLAARLGANVIFDPEPPAGVIAADLAVKNSFVVKL